MEEIAGLSVVTIAETAAEGIAAVTSQSGWRLAVLDLFLREGTGLEVLRACQNRVPGQRVVMLSNYPTVDMRQLCESLGADAFFDKSTEIDAFLEYCAAIR